MKPMLLLFSGGRDSTLLFKMAKAMNFNPICLIFKYGQKHVEEVEFAKRFCEKNGATFHVLELEFPVRSTLTGTETIYSGVSYYHVPSRNMLFVAYAAGIAESSGIDLIWYGANYEDRTKLFPDCYQEWVYNMNKVLKKNGSFPIQLEAPLLGMTKERIVKLCELYEVQDDEIFSGYGR